MPKPQDRYSDRAMANLLSLYDPEVVPSDLADSLLERHRSAGPSQATPPVFFRFSGLLKVSGGLALAAGLLLFLVPWPETLTPSASGPGVVALAPGFTTAGERIWTAPGTLAHREGLPAFGLGQPGPRAYVLDRGSLYLEHISKGPGFRIKTVFGTVEPLGTVLSLTVAPESLSLTCLDGAVLFLPASGAPGQPVRAGEILKLQTGTLPVVRPVRPVDEPYLPVKMSLPAVTVPVPGPVTPVATARPVPPPPTAPPVSLGPAKLWQDSLDVGQPVRLLTDGTSVVAAGPGGWEAFDLAGKPLLSKQDPGTIVLAQGIVFQYSRQILTARSLSPAQVLWTVPTGPQAFNGFVVDQGLVYFPSADGTLKVFDGKTGKTIRQFVLGAGSYGTPAVDGTSLYVSTVDHRLRAIDLSTGATRWTWTDPARFVGDKPVVWAGVLADGTKDGTILLLDPGKGTLLARVGYEGTLVWGPEVHGGQLLFRDSAGTKVLGPDGTLTPGREPDFSVVSVGALRLRTSDGELSAYEVTNTP